MKIHVVPPLFAACAALLAPTLLAQPAPGPVKEVREIRTLRAAAGVEAGVVPGQPVTFLGVAVGRNAELSAHLGLALGMGLVVNAVTADSPAAAVLRVHDVLTKFDDQWLVNGEQLAVLVRARKDGEEVTLSYIRGGQPATARVKLATRAAPEPPTPLSFQWDEAVDLQAAPGARVQVRRLPGAFTRAEVDRTLSLAAPPDGSGDVLFHAAPIARLTGVGEGRLAFNDAEGSIELTTVNGRRELTVKDADGKVVHQGPLASDEDRKALPDNVRQRLEHLERIDTLRFRTEDRFAPGDVRVIVPPARAEPIRLPLGPLSAPAPAVL